MICFCSGVYLVTGAAGACLYDLRQKKLWHIDCAFAELLTACASGKKTECSETERKALERLAKNGLICFGKPAGVPDIRSLHKTTQIQQAWIEVCRECNLRCIHCYNDSAPECSGRMTMPDFRLACQKLREADIRRVQLIGGEPLCHPDIEKMLTEAAALFERTELFTNGTMLTPEMCRMLKDLDVYTAISVYSYIPEMHDKAVGSDGAHTKTVRAIAMLRESGVPVRTATVHMKGIETGEKHGEPYTINPERDVIRMSGRGNTRLLTPELLRRKMITKESFRAPLQSEFVRDAVSGHPCFTKKIYVAYDLNVYPCVMERRISHGSLRHLPLQQILRKEILQVGKDAVTECRECEYRYACRDCRPDALHEDFYAKPYYCTYQVYKGEWMDETQKDQLIREVCDGV